MAKSKRKDKDFLGEVIRLKQFGVVELVIQSIEGEYFICHTLPDMEVVKIFKKTVRRLFKN